MNRILVSLPNWYGETLFATPFLRALRDQCSSAHIAAMGWPQCYTILEQSPLVDAFIEYDERGAHSGLGAKIMLIRKLRQESFDTAFVLRPSLSRSLIARAAGIKHCVGFSRHKSAWLLTHRVSPEQSRVHKARSYLPLLTCVGLKATPGPYEYSVSESEGKKAREFLDDLGYFSEHPLVILHPGANWSHKRWDPRFFGEVGRELAETNDARVLITGAPADVALGWEVSDAMRVPAQMIAGRTSPRQLAALFKHAQAVVAGDTGVLHLAAAVGAPIVALYGPTSPSITGPLGESQKMRILHHSDCCPKIPCYEPEHPGFPGMNALSVKEVLEAVRSLLGSAASHS